MPSFLRPVNALVKRLGSAPAAPEPEAGANDSAVQFKVEAALYRLRGVARSRVHVTVADGVVTVQGQARDTAQAKSIEAAVRRVPGVEGPEFRLDVPKAPPEPKGTAKTKGKGTGKGKSRAKAKDAS